MNWISRHRRKVNLVRIIRLAGLLALWAVALVVAGELPSLPEHQIKAVYLFNFTKYVDWPEDAFAGTNDCYTIGVAGSDDTFKDLVELSNTRTVKGRRLHIQRIERADDAKKCQIVYLGLGSDKLRALVLEAVGHAPILTVGEQENFLADGGMAHFAREENKLRVEINLEASQEARLTISARFLPIARIVRLPRQPRRN